MGKPAATDRPPLLSLSHSFTLDFVATAPTREVRETYGRPRLEHFLQERGLAFSEAKTQSRHMRDGCNCLGFHLRKFGRRQATLLTVPQQDNVLTHLREIRAYLDAQKQTPAVQGLKGLNPRIRGWAQYYRHVSAQAVLAKGGHAPWHMLGRWAHRRHPTKSGAWVKAHYYRDKGYWACSAGQTALVKPERTPLTRFTKVTGKYSPYAPTLRRYWRERKKRQVGRETFVKHRLRWHQRQGYRCALCRLPFVPGEPRETEHILPTRQGGSDDRDNKRLVQPWGHRQRHQQDGRQWRRAWAA